jgi:hypothetical protein
MTLARGWGLIPQTPMTTVFAHIGGMPVEETVVGLGPLLMAMGGYCWAMVRSRLGR